MAAYSLWWGCQEVTVALEVGSLQNKKQGNEMASISKSHSSQNCFDGL